MTLQFNKKSYPEFNMFMAMYSQSRPFMIGLGLYGKYSGIQTGVLNVTTTTAAGNNTFPCNNKLEVGSLIQFSNHNKLYRVMPGTTSTSITVFPFLQQNVQMGEVVKYDNLMVEMTIDPDNDWTMPIANKVDVSIKGREVING